MQYVWYIDIYFLVNFTMDLFLLKLLSVLLSVPASRSRLVIGACAGAGGSCVTVLLRQIPSGLSVGAVGIFTAAVMIGISFRPKTLRSFVKTLLLFFMEGFCVGGMLEAVYQHRGAGCYPERLPKDGFRDWMPLLAAVFSLTGTWFAIRFLWLNMVELRRERQHMYQVRVENRGHSKETIGYLDTGNCLRTPEGGEPVHIVSEELWYSLNVPEGDTIQIPFRTIGNPLGMMEGMKIEKLEIRKETGEKKILSDVWIARAPFRLTKEGDYEILLHKETFDNRRK